MKTGTTTSKGTKATEKEITFVMDKETKGAVRFVAEELEASNIYFKKTELADLGLEGKNKFTVSIKAE